MITTAGATTSHECSVCAFPARQEVDRDNHSWGNYVMCAYKGVHEHLASAGRPAPELVGLQLLVDGRVPQGALLQGPFWGNVQTLFASRRLYDRLARCSRAP